jgi:purine-binding chemotaxis protein CheW
VPLSPQYISGVVPYRGEVLTTVCFRVLLGLERWSKQRCVLILDDEDEGPFGLAMESVGEVVTIAQDALEPNPSVLDPRSMALFDGTYRLPAGLMVRLDPHRLHPSRLAETGLFADLKLEMI